MAKTTNLNPFDRLGTLLSILIEAFLHLFQNVTILVFTGILVVLGLLFLFFSLFGLT